MKKLNNKGFSILEALLIVVILGLIGIVGFFVYNAKKSTNDNSAAESSQSHTSSGAMQSSTTESKIGAFDFSYPKSWAVVSSTNASISIKSSDEQDNSEGAPSRGAIINVYSRVIDSSFFGGSLSDYMQNYGSETPTSTTIAGYTALRIDTGSVVAMAFTKDNYVYGVEEYYPAGSPNPYPTVVDNIARSFKSSN